MPVFLPANAKNRRSVISNVSPRPNLGRKSGWRTIENRLPSMARWNVSATIRPPTPRSRPFPVSASRRM